MEVFILFFLQFSATSHFTLREISFRVTPKELSEWFFSSLVLLPGKGNQIENFHFIAPLQYEPKWHSPIESKGRCLSHIFSMVPIHYLREKRGRKKWWMVNYTFFSAKRVSFLAFFFLQHLQFHTTSCILSIKSYHLFNKEFALLQPILVLFQLGKHLVWLKLIRIRNNCKCTFFESISHRKVCKQWKDLKY